MSNSAERTGAPTAVVAIRLALREPESAGERCVMHVDMARPRRGVWLATWPNLPGLILDLGRRTYTHTLLPGWEYNVQEMRTEMLEDLDKLATTGELPKVATRRG